MTGRIRHRVGWRDRTEPLGYAATVIMVAGVTAVANAAATVLPLAAIDLFYLIPVLAAASLYGMKAGALAAVTGALAYNFFFTSPRHTFWISHPADYLIVGVLLGVALFTGRLAARLRKQANGAEARATQDAALAEFSAQLIGISTEDELGSTVCEQISGLVGAHTALVAPDGRGLRIIASHPPLDYLGGFDTEAARQTLAEGRPSGRGTTTPKGADWAFYPLTAADGIVGALGLAREDGAAPVAEDRRALLATVLAQAALALERQRLAAEMAGVERLRERDRLRGALLSSVGHDLRTPLTAIFAATAELRQARAWNADAVSALESEARRLDRYIANLLDMARIEAGAIRLQTEPVDLTDVVAAAVRDVQRSLEEDDFSVLVPADLPLVRLDPQLFHHCLINLLENAVRHGENKPIAIVGERTADGLALSVIDEGPGLPPGSETRVFETFTRLEGSDRTGGTGLGLAIVKGFADAMGIRIEAGNRGGMGGAVFTLRFSTPLLVEGTAEAAE